MIRIWPAVVPKWTARPSLLVRTRCDPPYDLTPADLLIECEDEHDNQLSAAVVSPFSQYPGQDPHARLGPFVRTGEMPDVPDDGAGSQERAAPNHPDCGCSAESAALSPHSLWRRGLGAQSAGRRRGPLHPRAPHGDATGARATRRRSPSGAEAIHRNR